MAQQTIDTLNELLKGEQISINSYSQFIRDIKDDKVKSELKKIQSDHNKHSERISGRILELGGDPRFGTGMAGIMADVQHDLKGIKQRSDHDILLEAFQGEDKGIAISEKISDDQLDLDSMKLVHDILDTDHTHVKSLEDLLHESRLQ